ncbi:MAG: 16S rRNA (cytosine(1402)-N(4))-methyltransferase RsmH [Acidimicrobiales bacterium]
MSDHHEPHHFAHEPVLLAEVLELFTPVPAGAVVDATVGGGGHAAALLELRSDLRLVGIDRDDDALAAASARLGRFGERVRLVHARFDELGAVLDELGAGPLSGALFDLGASSPQLDRPERGFSLRFDGPLDMRMDRTAALTAADVVNTYPPERLAALFRDLGDEPPRLAARLARAVVAARPLRSTAQLASVVAAATPAAAHRRGHPATRVFQAVRIEVNGELDALPGALDAALERLAPGGRLVALAYHSGEDRIVKERLRRAETGGCVCPPRLPCVCGARPLVRLVRRGAGKASPAEVGANPRSASVRLRAAERLPADPPAAAEAARP